MAKHSCGSRKKIIHLIFSDILLIFLHYLWIVRRELAPRCVIDFGIMAEKIVPVVKAEEGDEEDLVDPQTVLREECAQKPAAQHLWGRYQECNDRVNSRTQTAETCLEELTDYLHVLDQCVVKDLFKRLK